MNARWCQIAVPVPGAASVTVGATTVYARSVPYAVCSRASTLMPPRVRQCVSLLVRLSQLTRLYCAYEPPGVLTLTSARTKPPTLMHVSVPGM